MNRAAPRPSFASPPAAYSPDYLRTILRSLDQWAIQLTAIGDEVSSRVYVSDFHATQPIKAIHLDPDGSQDLGIDIAAEQGNAHISSGAYYDGASWVAKRAAAIICTLNPTTGKLSVSYNTGLTPGASYMPTEVAHLP